MPSSPNAMNPSASAWARARLVLGDSKGALWEVRDNIAEARIAVGSSSKCAWVVTGPGIAPIHFELFWDGASLWVGNSENASGIRVDGHPLRDWEALYDRSRIEFGTAVMSIEASATRPVPAIQSDDEDSIPELGGERTMIGEGLGDMASSNSAIVKERMSLAGDRAYETGASQLSDLAVVPERRPIPESPTRALPVSDDATRAPAIPHQPSTGGSSTKIVSEGARSTDLANEATRLGDARMLDIRSPNAALAPAASLPRAGLGTMSSSAAASLPPGKPTVATPVASAFAAPPPAMMPAPQISAPASPAFAPPPAANAQAGFNVAAVPPPPASGTVSGNAGPFAAPPPPDPDATSRALSNLTAKFSAITEGPKLSVPLLTWLLLGLVVAIVVVFVIPSDDEEPDPTANEGAPSAQTTPRVADVAPVPQAMAVSAQGIVGDARPSADTNPNPPTQRAADLLVAGRWNDALTHYEALALADGRNPVYAKIAQVLRRRIADQCHDGVNAHGEPCDVTP